MKTLKISAVIVSLLCTFSCQEKKNEVRDGLNSVKTTSGKLTTEEVSYDIDGKNYKSFVAYKGDASEVKPVVMVLPEWWGVTDYTKNRAKDLAELGYFAMVVDYYGDGKTVDNPEEAAKLSGEFYKIPIDAKLKFDKAKAQLLKFPNANYDKIAVIGYCFGGAQALNMARLEDELKGVVSFHGNLMTGIKPKNNDVKILVCNGAADTYVPAEEIAAFKKQMDSAKIDYKFVDYPNALHSFTNPASTAIGEKFKMKVAYNKEADVKSWNDMKAFLIEIFK
ncbi:dienelactone hydrolase family protein [Kaistella flava (ex Peng et al. 2021)]|uniref:Dienelactone hydrolase family protein n=1 Tax=Kaistella flava (ex Peng et al. 2021) TaxID=2038776 RepID=A0A7M2YAW8_9FLAO|nr:dienelactone hydrolase family protein [Kaistella flava (ex Peng et al. 2021)]QOW10503.1 dienelactone hydrolase family protein [Kaistella flava (ex Peng et al. 2021)]